MGLISILRIHSRQNMQGWKKTSETNLSLETFGAFFFVLNGDFLKPRVSSKSNNNKHFAKSQQSSKSCVIFTRTVAIQPNGPSESLRDCFCSACRGNQQSLFFLRNLGEDGVISRFTPQLATVLWKKHLLSPLIHCSFFIPLLERNLSWRLGQKKDCFWHKKRPTKSKWIEEVLRSDGSVKVQQDGLQSDSSSCTDLRDKGLIINTLCLN